MIAQKTHSLEYRSFYKGIQKDFYSKYYKVIFYYNHKSEFGCQDIAGYFTNEPIASYHHSVESIKRGLPLGEFNLTALNDLGLQEYKKQLALQKEFIEDWWDEFRACQKHAFETAEYFSKIN